MLFLTMLPATHAWATSRDSSRFGSWHGIRI